MALTIRIEAGRETEELIQFMLDKLGEEGKDIDVEREQASASGVASEPITTACVVSGLGLAGILALARVIEKWLENGRQRDALELVLDGFSESGDAGNAMAELAAKHKEIAIRYGIPKVPTNPWPHGTEGAK
jgi:hypothetical protein